MVENASNFYESILGTPACGTSFLNDSVGIPAFERTGLHLHCSTPACKHHISKDTDIENIPPKIRKLNGNEISPDSTILDQPNSEVDIGVEIHPLTTINENKNDSELKIPNISGSEVDTGINNILVPTKNNDERKNDLESTLLDKFSTKVIAGIENKLPNINNLNNKDEIDLESTILELDSECEDQNHNIDTLGQSQSSSQSFQSVRLGLSIEDDFLLMSSSEEEDDADLDTYIHLLDSPEHSDEETETTLEHKENFDASNATILQADKTLVEDQNALPKTSDSIEAESLQIGSVSKAIQKSPIKSTESNLKNSLTLNKFQTKSRRFVPRSEALKSYIKDFQFKQQKRYPAWLERAKESCTRYQLESLMQTIYEPNFCNNRERFVLESLSINNYRTSLKYCGVNPNRTPRNTMPSDFYHTSPKSNIKRFAVQ